MPICIYARDYTTYLLLLTSLWSTVFPDGTHPLLTGRVYFWLELWRNQIKKDKPIRDLHQHAGSWWTTGEHTEWRFWSRAWMFWTFSFVEGPWWLRRSMIYFNLSFNDLSDTMERSQILFLAVVGDLLQSLFSRPRSATVWIEVKTSLLERSVVLQLDEVPPENEVRPDPRDQNIMCGRKPTTIINGSNIMTHYNLESRTII